MSTWQPHGQDYQIRRGKWTLSVRRMREGWDYAIHYGRSAIDISRREWDRIEDAQAACLESVREIAADLTGEEDGR